MGPAFETRREVSLEDALEQARAGALILTASRRLARALEQHYNRSEQAAGRQVWAAPVILHWPAWLAELWDTAALAAAGAIPVLLEAHQAHLVWQRAIEQSPHADGLLHVAPTATTAEQSWELMHSWRLERSAVEPQTSDDARAFLAWASAFEEACRSEGWLDRARLPDTLAERLAGLHLPARVILAGFDEFTPQQRAFLNALERAGVDLAVVAAASPEAEPVARRIAFPDGAAELAAAARWVRGLLERGQAGEIAVVVRDLQTARGIGRIFAEVLDPPSVLPGAAVHASLFNMSASSALASYPLVHAALLALSLEPERNELALVSALLRSRFFRGAEAEWTLRAALEAELRCYGSLEVSAARIERLARRCGCHELARLLAGWSREVAAVTHRQAPAGWARTFSALLGALGWPGGRPLGSAEFQTVERWHRLLSEFASLETVSAQMSRSEALSHLRRMAEQAIFQPESAAAPVQILGLLETAGLRFDHLWIAGLDDESWPTASRPDPFLPLRLQRERGLPHASPERELAFARMVTERLLSSASDIVVSHALRGQDDRELAPSPLIRRVPEISAALFGEDAPPSYAELIRRSSAMEALEDRRGPPLAGAAHQAGGTRIFQLQALCPFRAFAALRLGAEPLAQPVPGLSPADRGQLVHRALAHVWNELSTHSRLVEASDQELAEVVRAGIERALAWLAERRDQDLPARFAALEQRRLERLLLAWLENEKGRAPFTVVEVEGEHYADLGGIRVKVRVDRIDRLAEGGDVIIDYKTGRATPSDWKGERPEEPQLPVYATAHTGPLAAVLFGKVRTGDIAFRGFAARAGLVPGAEERDPEALIAEWRPVLERLGADFRAGAAEVDPKSLNVCRTCSLMPLCRIHEAEVSASALDSAEEDDA